MEMKNCPNCNEEFNDNSGFCHSCGYYIKYNATEADEEIILPKEDSELEKKQAQILAEGIVSLIFAVNFAPIGLPLSMKNIKQAKEFLAKTGELKNKALVGYTLSKIARIYSTILLSVLGGVIIIMLISALLQ